MLPLRDLQAAMAAGVLGEDAEPLAALVRADGIPPAQRLQVYRNNTMVSLTEALKETFGVVCQLVDERFFRYAAHAYIQRHPPRAPRLSEYGGDFADFLAQFERARHLRYLPDVARLEWAVNLAFHAADAPTLDPLDIAAIPAERHPGLRLHPHPSCQLLFSPYPVDRIWAGHQPGGSLDGVDLGAGECRLLIDRRSNEIRFLTIGAAELAFLSALRDGRALQQAYESAVEADPAFDLAGALAKHLTRGTFTGLAES
jgi:hypothetical protein